MSTREREVVVVPDYVEAIVAWRVWSVYDRFPGYLHAITNGKRWDPEDPMIAQCNVGIYGGGPGGIPGPHDSPHTRCTCGIYAVKDLRDILGYCTPRQNTAWVLGTVSLWGKIVEHKHGYRAEFAYPHSICGIIATALSSPSQPSGDKASLAILQTLEDYNVPFESLPSPLDKMWKGFDWIRGAKEVMNGAVR